MDFISLTTEQGAAYLFNIHNITLIDATTCQLYTVDNPAYGWTLSQKSMDDLMGAIQSHIVAADAPVPAPPVEPMHWDYPLNTAEPVAHVIKEWNPNDVLEKVDEPKNWGNMTETLEHLIELNHKKGKLLKKALEAAYEMEANEAREDIRL